MDFDHSRDGDSEVLTFSPPVRPLLIFFTVVTAAVVLAIALTFMLRPMSYMLMGILIVTGGFVVRTLMVTVELMLKTTIRLDKAGLHINRLFNSSSHAWELVDEVKLIPSIGSLADDPNTEARNRLGLGLFLKGSKKERAHALDPDEVIITASDKFERQLSRTADTIARYQARQGQGGPARSRAAAQPAAFRRQARPASGAAMPSGQSTIPARARGTGFGQRER